MKHVKLSLSLLLLAGVLLTACGGAAAFQCTDKLGCVDIGPNDPIHIAYLFVTSGDNSTLGLDTQYGAQLAIDDAGG